MKLIIKKASFWLIPITCTLAVTVLMKTVFLLGYVPTASMEPRIAEGSYILGVRVYDELAIGDIVVFEKDGRTLVKRIAAIEGDMVCINDKTHEVEINAELIPWTRKLTVPSRCYFLVGDNSINSIDSRFWDNPFITEDQIIAKLL